LQLLLHEPLQRTRRLALLAARLHVGRSCRHCAPIARDHRAGAARRRFCSGARGWTRWTRVRFGRWRSGARSRRGRREGSTRRRRGRRSRRARRRGRDRRDDRRTGGLSRRGCGRFLRATRARAREPHGRGERCREPRGREHPHSRDIDTPGLQASPSCFARADRRPGLTELLA
jgi:hypothetical protein